MKRCPSCRRSYVDDTLVYCLEDGSTLVSADGADLPATIIMQDPRATSPAGPETRQQSPVQTVNPPQPFSAAPPQQQQAWPHSAGLLAQASVPARHGRGAALGSLVCAIAAFALLGFCFIGGAAGVNESFIGGVFILAAAVGLVGAVLGIVAVSMTGKDTSPQNSRATAIVGLVLNCLYLLITLLFLILGASGSLG